MLANLSLDMNSNEQGSVNISHCFSKKIYISQSSSLVTFFNCPYKLDYFSQRHEKL